jgi:D-sedoheptulose 7-phosphate isomerase
MLADQIKDYASKLSAALVSEGMTRIPLLCEAFEKAWKADRTVFLCGNGGSAANTIHLANDLLYGAGVTNGRGLRVEALSANAAVITCLANDLGYESIFSQQLQVKAERDDLLVVFSGSGNSPNVISALETGNALGMNTFAVLGYSGGRCKDIARVSIHFPVDDMQIVEDLQMIVGHICMQWLSGQNLSKRKIEK